MKVAAEKNTKSFILPRLSFSCCIASAFFNPKAMFLNTFFNSVILVSFSATHTLALFYLSSIFIFLSIIFFKFYFVFNFTILYWFCHISKWIRHRYTCVPHPEPSSLPIPSLWVVPVHQPQTSSIVHRNWTGDSFHIWYYTYFNAILPNHPTLSLPHKVQKTVLYISVSLHC